MPDPNPCRSEHARDEPENTAGCQASSVIVDDHRERARSYRGKIARSKKAPTGRGFEITLKAYSPMAAL
jgi:hypothetical protein